MDPEDNKYWCSTLVDENGLHVNDQGKWGHCGNGCPIQQAGKSVITFRIWNKQCNRRSNINGTVNHTKLGENFNLPKFLCSERFGNRGIFPIGVYGNFGEYLDHFH